MPFEIQRDALQHLVNLCRESCSVTSLHSSSIWTWTNLRGTFDQPEGERQEGHLE